MSVEVNIRQIIPATGWRARYWRPYEPYYEFVRLISFALVEDSQGKSMVFGMDQHGHLCELSDAFGDFFHEEDITEELKSQCANTGRERAQREK